MREVHVTVDERKFIVKLYENGEPHSIKQRKLYAPGKPYEAWYNAPYWHHSAKLGGPNTRPQRILAETRKLCFPVTEV
jgi:outer membrane translocation and assembly module TamA